MELSEITIDRPIIWKHEQCGGWSSIERTAGKVVKVGEKQVCIKVQKKNGKHVTGWVDANNLESDKLSKRGS